MQREIKRDKGGGFTLIELLVVISIIGLLSSIALASLNSARDRAANAAVKSNLATLRSQASLYFENNNGSYAGLLDNSANITEKSAFRSAVQASGVSGYAGAGFYGSSESVFVALVTLRGAISPETINYWCVDSLGFSGNVSTASIAGFFDLQGGVMNDEYTYISNDFGYLTFGVHSNVVDDLDMSCAALSGA